MRLVLFFVLGIQTSFGNTLQDKLNIRKKKGKAPAEVRREFKRATNELKASGIEKTALAQGVRVPHFQINGKDIEAYYKERPLILKFYRGHWCPYCMIELKEYQNRFSEISKYGQFVALVPDKLSEIKRTLKRHKLTLPIFRDADNQIAKKFGLVFKVDKKVLKLYKSFGIELEKSQGNQKGELPMPGTYVINRQGRLVFAFFDADYTQRADVDEVVKALKQAAK